MEADEWLSWPVWVIARVRGFVFPVRASGVLAGGRLFVVRNLGRVAQEPCPLSVPPGGTRNMKPERGGEPRPLAPSSQPASPEGIGLLVGSCIGPFPLFRGWLATSCAVPLGSCDCSWGRRRVQCTRGISVASQSYSGAPAISWAALIQWPSAITLHLPSPLQAGPDVFLYFILSCRASQFAHPAYGKLYTVFFFFAFSKSSTCSSRNGIFLTYPMMGTLLVRFGDAGGRAIPTLISY